MKLIGDIVGLIPPLGISVVVRYIETEPEEKHSVIKNDEVRIFFRKIMKTVHLGTSGDITLQGTQSAICDVIVTTGKCRQK